MDAENSQVFNIDRPSLLPFTAVDLEALFQDIHCEIHQKFSDRETEVGETIMKTGGLLLIFAKISAINLTAA